MYKHFFLSCDIHTRKRDICCEAHLWSICLVHLDTLKATRYGPFHVSWRIGVALRLYLQWLKARASLLGHPPPRSPALGATDQSHYLTSLLNSKGLMSDGQGAVQWDEGWSGQAVWSRVSTARTSAPHLINDWVHKVCQNYLLIFLVIGRGFTKFMARRNFYMGISGGT